MRQKIAVPVWMVIAIPSITAIITFGGLVAWAPAPKAKVGLPPTIATTAPPTTHRSTYDLPEELQPSLEGMSATLNCSGSVRVATTLTLMNNPAVLNPTMGYLDGTEALTGIIRQLNQLPATTSFRDVHNTSPVYVPKRCWISAADAFVNGYPGDEMPITRVSYRE